jgi:hypothetical protein
MTLPRHSIACLLAACLIVVAGCEMVAEPPATPVLLAVEDDPPPSALEVDSETLAIHEWDKRL